MNAARIEPGLAQRHRAAAARLYWSAFAPKLGHIMRPEPRALAFFETAFDPRFVYCALDPGGDLLGVAGFKTADGAFTGGGFAALARAYGLAGATWRAALLSVLERPLEPGILLMDGICVHPDARGQGIGAALLDRIARHASDAGYHGVRLDVIDTNPRAHALYARKGFVAQGQEHLGPLRHVFGFRSATRMVLPLQQAPGP